MAIDGPDPLVRPVYGMGQAARLLGLRRDVLRRWVDGEERAGVERPPVLRPARTGADEVTWGEFVEAAHLREHRARGGVRPLRPVVGLLRRELGVAHPLATRLPYSSARRAVLDVQGLVGLDPALCLVVADGRGRPQLGDAAHSFVEKVDFAGDVAQRLYPMGRQVPVVLDPDRGFGEPTVRDGVRTEVLAELVGAGEPPERVARLHDVPVADVRAAVAYERIRRQSAAA